MAPADYGLFALAYAALSIATQLSELGLDTAIGRMLSKAKRLEDEETGDKVLKTAFGMKMAAALTVLAVGYLTATPVAESILGRPEVAPYLRIAYFGVIGLQLQGFYLAYFAARLEFVRGALFGALSPLVILVAVVVCWWRQTLDVEACVRIYAFAPLVVGVVAFAALPPLLARRGPRVATLGALWRFGRWIYASNVLGTLRYRMNSILLSRMATMEAVGLYNYGDKLASTLSLFSSTILTVFVPRVSHLITPDELRGVLRQNYRWLVALLPVSAVALLGARPLILMLAPDYVEAAPVFALLFISILLSLLALPSRTVLYSVNRQQVETGIEATALVLVRVWG